MKCVGHVTKENANARTTDTDNIVSRNLLRLYTYSDNNFVVVQSTQRNESKCGGKCCRDTKQRGYIVSKDKYSV